MHTNDTSVPSQIEKIKAAMTFTRVVASGFTHKGQPVGGEATSFDGIRLSLWGEEGELSFAPSELAELNFTTSAQMNNHP